MSVDMILVKDIYVDPSRQREDKDVEDLLPSIKARGIIQPLVVEMSGGAFTLIAGERRLICAKQLKMTEVPARIFSSLKPVEKEIIELEENLHRKDLGWKELCLAICKIHENYRKLEPAWTKAQTAQQINYAEASTSSIIAVGEELLKGTNKEIASASGWTTAYNVIVRRNQRRADDVFNELMEEEKASPDPVSSVDTPTQHTPVNDNLVLDKQSIFCCDFREWIKEYKGPAFTFVHCDFPYGIDLDKSDQGGSATWGAYGDSEETYQLLLKTFTDNLDKLMAPYSHLMFWLSSDWEVIYNTICYLEQTTDLRINPKPLIWHKSDNRGILPDPKRGPRHVYETAIFASRGDRFIHQSVVDAYSAPAGEKSHQSEKAEPMLRHFFRMFVSEGTRFLDPTCGSGTSLCAAESLGAEALGLEIDPGNAELATARLRKQRNLARYGVKK